MFRMLRDQSTWLPHFLESMLPWNLHGGHMKWYAPCVMLVEVASLDFPRVETKCCYLYMWIVYNAKQLGVRLSGQSSLCWLAVNIHKSL